MSFPASLHLEQTVRVGTFLLQRWGLLLCFSSDFGVSDTSSAVSHLLDTEHVVEAVCQAGPFPPQTLTAVLVAFLPFSNSYLTLSSWAPKNLRASLLNPSGQGGFCQAKEERRREGHLFSYSGSCLCFVLFCLFVWKVCFFLLKITKRWPTALRDSSSSMGFLYLHLDPLFWASLFFFLTVFYNYQYPKFSLALV